MWYIPCIHNRMNVHCSFVPLTEDPQKNSTLISKDLIWNDKIILWLSITQAFYLGETFWSNKCSQLFNHIKSNHVQCKNVIYGWYQEFRNSLLKVFKDHYLLEIKKGIVWPFAAIRKWNTPRPRGSVTYLLIHDVSLVCLERSWSYRE